MNLNMGLENLTNMGAIRNSSKVISMNEAGIDALAVATMQIAMTANDYLNKIRDIMDKTKSFYQGTAANELRRKFNEQSADFIKITQNIENYAYSLKKAKAIMMERNLDAISQLNRAATNVQDLINNEK